MKDFTIKFSASGTVGQKLRILDDSYTPEDIVKGLNAGNYLTTIAHSEDIDAQWSEVTDLSGERIALIIEQELVSDDGAGYHDFEIGDWYE